LRYDAHVYEALILGREGEGRSFAFLA